DMIFLSLPLLFRSRHIDIGSALFFSQDVILFYSSIMKDDLSPYHRRAFAGLQYEIIDSYRPSIQNQN
ncbi:hypothetical protein OQ642_25930, partial [Klebsiella pneumoniae]|nr:hypothetical protein [Klebsiella pneumoniae]